MAAQPVDDDDPDDPMEILSVLPEDFHQQFLAEYALNAAGDRTQAVSEGLQTLPGLEGPVRSARALNWLRPIRQDAPHDGEFAARFDAVAVS